MLKNILFAVSDIERSKAFYQKYFGLQIINDFGENVIFTEGLVLQEQKSWEQLIGERSVTGNASELFFVETDLDIFLSKIENYMLESDQTMNVRVNSWGKRALMLKDPDGHLIEVAER
jgi:catechol 2,3-dioxygenase-like lactoylglutathione lyase family enzyme